VQIVIAGNNSEGLRYGTIGTEEKYFLQWKEDETDNTGYKLDKYLGKMCRKERLLELLTTSCFSTAEKKKLPRGPPIFRRQGGASVTVIAYQGGIIWQHAGLGQSIVMVLLAKWILGAQAQGSRAHPHRPRRTRQTDRRRLPRLRRSDLPHQQRRDLMTQLGQAKPRLLCSLVPQIRQERREGFRGLHQGTEEPAESGGGRAVSSLWTSATARKAASLHKTMKALLPGAVFIGFTGTPLLKQDKETTYEVFGDYIHTYKFGEAVEDGVVLDLLYEARDIEQTLGSQDKIDAWFEAKTKGLNAWQKAALREQWGTMPESAQLPFAHGAGR